MLQFFKRRGPQGVGKFLPHSSTNSTPDDPSFFNPTFALGFSTFTSCEPPLLSAACHCICFTCPYASVEFSTWRYNYYWFFFSFFFFFILFVCLFLSESSTRNTHVLHLGRDQTNFLSEPLQYQMSACLRVTSSTVT